MQSCIFKRLGPGKDQPSQQRRLGRRKEQRAMDAADAREEELQDRLLKGTGQAAVAVFKVDVEGAEQAAHGGR